MCSPLCLECKYFIETIQPTGGKIRRDQHYNVKCIVQIKTIKQKEFGKKLDTHCNTATL